MGVEGGHCGVKGGGEGRGGGVDMVLEVMMRRGGFWRGGWRVWRWRLWR